MDAQTIELIGRAEMGGGMVVSFGFHGALNSDGIFECKVNGLIKNHDATR